ncbi:MAG: HNH endonuclease [Deltaproteobacteria bacterium]|nr:HNH endonuclease [Deltaproteobacteria bacterium]
MSLIGRPPIPRDARYIEERCIPEPNTGCWLWTGARSTNGYGQTPRNRHAHRLAFEILVGSIPDGQHVLHRCDTRACVNPDHLFLGTHADNMADKMSKGRHRAPLRLPALSSDVMREICESNGVAQHILADLHGVSQATISRIRTGRRWSDLTGVRCSAPG